MNLSSPTQSLQARAQPGGITPELIRLLAQMKVKQETDAAARDMAMKMGQQPPTVAEGLNEELEGNWRQKLEQKIGGLQAIAQQQAPQGAPTMPAPPAQPTQHMAAGGLTKLRSNLPGNYAGGGIVAFNGKYGSDVPDTEWTARRPHETNADYALRMEAGPNYNKVNPESFGADIAGLVGRGKDAVLAWMRQRDAALNQARMQPAGAEDNSGREQFRTMPTSPEAAQSEAPWVNAPASVQPDRPRVNTQRPAPVVPQPAAPVAAPVSGLQAAYDKSAIKGINADAEAAGNTAADTFATRQQAALGADQAALRAARLQDYEQAKAAQMARDKSGAPSIWDRLGTLGQNAAYGNWGRAAGQQRDMELAHEAQKAEGAKGLLALKQASDAMALADKTGTFTGTEAARTAGRAATAAEKKDAMDTASRLLAQRGQDAAHLQGIGMNNETQLKVANIQAASHKAAAKIAADRQDQVDKRNDITGLKSEIAIAEKSLAKYTPQALMLLTPGTPEHAEAIQEMAWAKAVREANRARLAELTGVEYKTAPAAGGTTPLTPEQEAKRKKILGG